jgi:hypothetical protein
MFKAPSTHTWVARGSLGRPRRDHSARSRAPARARMAATPSGWPCGSSSRNTMYVQPHSAGATIVVA